MYKIMLANFKGGVGKTASSVSIAHALALKNKKVILVDADPQANTTNWIEPEDAENELADIINGVDVERCIVKTKIDNLDMIITYQDGILRKTSENTLQNTPFVFKQAFGKLIANYDFMIIDSSPSFSALERSIALASDEIIVPVELEFFSVDGFAEFRRQIAELNKNWEKNIKLNKVILTKENRSFSRHKVLKDDIIAKIKDFQFTYFTVRQDANMAECMGLNETIFQRDINSKSAEDYIKIVDAILKEVD